MRTDETRVRRAETSDLQRIWNIRFRNDIDGAKDSPAQGPIPPFLPHLLATGDVRVAERDGELIGYASVAERSDVVYLTDLFVEPGRQSRGAGRRLLDAILLADAPRRCVLASNDFRALALYTRFGMPPLWPVIWLEVASEMVHFPEFTDVQLVEVGLESPDLVEIDALLSGRCRPVDLRYWEDREAGRAFLCMHRGQTVGYGVVRLGAGRNWHPEAASIGPVGVMNSVHAAGCLTSIASWAATQAPFLETLVPGPHPGLPSLLTAGFHIGYVGTYGAVSDRLVDPTRYIGSGGDLF